jgi:hypothetical protein
VRSICAMSFGHAQRLFRLYYKLAADAPRVRMRCVSVTTCQCTITYASCSHCNAAHSSARTPTHTPNIHAHTNTHTHTHTHAYSRTLPNTEANVDCRCWHPTQESESCAVTPELRRVSSHRTPSEWISGFRASRFDAGTASVFRPQMCVVF